MAENEDVTPESSPGLPDTTAEVPETDASPVTDVQEPADRPWQNIKAEFDRKLTKVERQMAEVSNYLAQLTQQNQRSTPQPPTQTREYTDDELLELKMAGNREADRLYTERIAQRISQQQNQANQLLATYQQQLAKLYNSYPVLQDTNHPLTMSALRAKALLVQMGHPQNHPYTDVQAILHAVADNPQIVSEITQRSANTQDAVRRTSANAQASIDGSSPRRQATPNPASQVKLSPKAYEIAKRMGVDPVKAMKRFDERQKKGQSSASPTVANIVREEGGSTNA